MKASVLGTQRFVGVVGATVGLVAALIVARPAVACAGCGVPMSDFVHEVSALFVATSDGSIAPDTYRLTVGPVLLGTVPAQVTYRAVGGEPAMPRDSRWIIAIYPVDRAALRTGVLDGRSDAAWSVAPNGRIELGQVLAPPTLSGLLAWFGLPATDSEPVPVGQGPTAGWRWELILAVFGFTCPALTRYFGDRRTKAEVASRSPWRADHLPLMEQDGGSAAEPTVRRAAPRDHAHAVP